MVKCFYLSLFICNSLFSQSNKCNTELRVVYQSENIKPLQINTTQKWNVPVIFHVLFHIDRENVQDSLVNEILLTLHEDFLNLNADLNSVPDEFKEAIGNPNINFFLAKELPDGTQTTGIIRQYTKISQFDLSKRTVFQESPIIDNRAYLNVYVCNVNTNAYTPSENNPDHDGIVINYKKVYKGSRTLTHETGHWFDLRHIFEGGCSNNDGVKDTPSQKKHSFYCPTYPRKECEHSTMFMNYMDYSSCRCFFTVGQVIKMRIYISKFKSFKP